MEPPPQSARIKRSNINGKIARSTFRASKHFIVLLNICQRSRFRQFIAESGRSLGYALGSVIELFYEAGPLVAAGPSGGLPDPFVGEERTRQLRAPASAYRETVLSLRAQGVPHEDRASDFEKIPLESRVAMEPRPYQKEALGAWRRDGLRGVVVLPTGAGKTAVAVSAMERVGRSTLVVVPTLALLKQWYSVLQDAFGSSVTIGLLGGGYHEITPITVTTYDSAYIHAERYGDRFALGVYDEVHHLPAPKNAIIAKMLLAPYALGLTATPERPDGGHGLLPELVGPVVYRRSPEDLAGTYLAPFELVRIPIELTAQERFDYAQAEAVYRDFLEKHRLPMRSPEDWQRFIMVASTSHSGGPLQGRDSVRRPERRRRRSRRRGRRHTRRQRLPSRIRPASRPYSSPQRRQTGDTLRTRHGPDRRRVYGPAPQGGLPLVLRSEHVMARLYRGRLVPHNLSPDDRRILALP